VIIGASEEGEKTIIDHTEKDEQGLILGTGRCKELGYPIFF